MEKVKKHTQKYPNMYPIYLEMFVTSSVNCALVVVEADTRQDQRIINLFCLQVSTVGAK
jgi:hypothetical protein